MTKFDGYMERVEEKRKLAKEAEVDIWLMQSLRTRTKDEVVKELSDNLTLVLGVSSLMTTERAKTLVF